MPRTPKKQMPQAAPHAEDEDDFENTGFYEWDPEEEDRSVLERVSELARDNPKSALGAGVALIAGAIAGLAWPFVKAKRADAPKRRQPARKSRGAGQRGSASAGTGKAKGASGRKGKSASAGTGGRRKAASSTPAAKAAPSAGAAKPRKQRSDKGKPRGKRAPAATTAD